MPNLELDKELHLKMEKNTHLLKTKYATNKYI